MACQKVSKQGRDDIIVKVNLQSPIPTSFIRVIVLGLCVCVCLFNKVSRGNFGHGVFPVT